MARGSYDTTGNPKPGPTIISSESDASTSTSRFLTLANYNRLDPDAAAAEDVFSDLGRGGYDITNSPKPAPKPRPESPEPKPQQPKPDTSKN
ncbi:uncharacterized protein PG986_014511 [Apiospora aurea]|uniref:Uncharacterized protein n=1 Tax=Apiospora aurea TaxID=335848 RepID=A0ABR1PTI1_9PEZI